MSKEKLSAASIFDQIPDDLLAEIGSCTRVDYNVSRLYGKVMLQLLVIGMLRSDRLSTHLLSDLYSSPFFQRLNSECRGNTAHSSIAARLSTMPYQYFAQVFDWVYEHYRSILQDSTKGRRILSFDSTMVAISSALIDKGMRVGRLPKDRPAKMQIKFTVAFHAGLPKSFKLFTDQSSLSEEVALKKAIEQTSIEQGDIVVFDAGLQSRQTFAGFDQAGIQFVTRLRSDARWSKVGQHANVEDLQTRELDFIRDELVQLYGPEEKLIEQEFRLVELEIKEGKNTGKRLLLLTNIFDLGAMDIAQTYRKRWEIEVFFRFVKQQLNVKHLLNRTENGILIQMYCAMIAAIFILVYKKVNQIKAYNIAKFRFEDRLLFHIMNLVQQQPNSS